MEFLSPHFQLEEEPKVTGC